MNNASSRISVFFDLETSDLLPVGQILNFAFVAVDDDFKVVEQYADLVRVSRLQLPRANALIANRTDILAHQGQAKLSEYGAAQKIEQFLIGLAKTYPNSELSLIGFNSSEFDLGFLRTVFIRNGVNPYFSRYLNRDLLLIARELLATNDGFRERFFKLDAGEEKPSLRLERLCRKFGLLEGEQLHESLFDVKLTIELAKVFASEFGIDVRTFEPYRVKNLHRLPVGSRVVLAEPVKRGYSLGKRMDLFPAILIDATDKAALWANIDRYLELKQAGESAKKSIRWIKTNDGLLTQHGEVVSNDPLALELKEALKDVNLKNYFETPECYIEQHIYRFNVNKLEALRESLKIGRIVGEADADMVTLFRRFQLENAPLVLNSDLEESFKRYVRLRYQGDMLLSKTREEGKFHPTYAELVAEIEKAKKDTNSDQQKILGSLEQFYQNSDIARALENTAKAA